MEAQTEQLPLKRLFLRRAEEKRKKSALEEATLAFLRGAPYVSFIENLRSAHSSKECLEQLEALLCNHLLLHLSKGEDYTLLRLTSEQLLQKNPWKEHQLIQAFLHLLSSFVNQSATYELPTLFESGAAPIHSAFFDLVDELPLQPLHAKLASLWVLLSSLEGQGEWLAAAEKVGKWQLNLLDADFKPMVGLISREESADFSEIATWNFLLFTLLAAETGSRKMSYAALRQLEWLEKEPGRLPLLALFIEMFFADRELPEPEVFSLGKQIEDRSLGIVGVRNKKFSAACTFFGSRTGAGALVTDEIALLSYGPDHLPFGECSRFGMMTTPSMQQQFPHFKIKSQSEEGFEATSIVQVADGHFIELTQTIAQNILTINALVLSPHMPPSFAFSFFIRAASCVVDGKEIRPRSLDHFRGEACSCRFVSEKWTLKINGKGKFGNIEIIPLAGDNSFWGADYLLGFSFTDSPQASWTLKLTRNPTLDL